MNPTAWMEEKGICVGITLKEKEGVIDILAALQQKCGNTEQSKQLKRDIYYREEEAGSAIGAGVAICQVCSNAVKKGKVTAVTVPDGVNFDAPDGDKTRLIFLVAFPPEKKEHPASRLAVLLMDENLREQLIGAADEKTFLRLLKLAENGEYGAVQEGQQEMPLILAVIRDREATRGASMLQLAAGRLGKLLKIEQYPAQSFTAEELQEAKGILLIGEGIPTIRFEGKPVLIGEFSDSLHRPEHLLNQVEKAPIHFNKTSSRKTRLGSILLQAWRNWRGRSNLFF